MRLPDNRHATAIAGALAVISLMTALPASAAVTGVRIGRAIQLRLPLSAAKRASSVLLTVDCAGAGACLAGGSYSPREYRSFAMIARESGGHFAQASKLRRPAGALESDVASVDCTAVSTCTAVGGYFTIGSESGFAVTESAGRWQRPHTISPPTSGGLPQLITLNAVSCFAAGSCEAVGVDEQGQGFDPITVTESHGIWSRSRLLRLPPNGVVGALLSISCPRHGYCVAVGDYVDNANSGTDMAAVEWHGKWQRAHQIQLPRGAAGGIGQQSNLGSVSCTGVGSCLAVGSYDNAAGHSVPMLVIESHGRWALARAVSARPANANARRNSTLDSVSCRRTGSCLGLGSYFTKSGRPETMFVTLAPGHRAAAAELRLPPNGASAGEPANASTAGAVDCTSAWYCAAGGIYKTTSGREEAWTATTPLRQRGRNQRQ